MMSEQLNFHIQKNEVGRFIPYTIISTKWINNLNIITETIYLLEGSIGVDQ